MNCSNIKNALYQKALMQTETYQNPPNQMLKKSTSMYGILHGENAHPNCSHYVDSLERFERDYAKYDKVMRTVENHNKEKKFQQRRKLKLDRENNFRLSDDFQRQKAQKKYQNSRILFDLGIKKTAHSAGIPVNPITLQYHNTIGGYHQLEADNEDLLRKLARSKNLLNRSSSGYNVVNGFESVKVEEMVPKGLQQNFNNKVLEYNKKYSLRT